MNTRPGYKLSLLHKAGIKITPIGIGAPKTVCTKFRIKVTKTGKGGKEIEQKGKNPFQTYPLKGSKDNPNVWDKMEEIKNYYYEKLQK